jgi:hypothetical protein
VKGMPRKKPLKVIREKGRGLVPGPAYGVLDIAYNEFLDELNPRERKEVRIALAATKDNRFKEFLRFVGMPVAGTPPSLASCAKRAGIDLNEFQDWALKSANQRSIAIATDRGPRLTALIADNAEEIVEFCDRCDGLGWISAQAGMPLDTPGYEQIGIDAQEQPLFRRECPHGADGKIRRLGSEHAQDKILEISGLASKKGPMVQITQNIGSSSHASALSDLDAMSLDGEFERV